MSDGKEVKRFYFVPTGEKDFFGRPTFVCDNKPLNGDVWFMPVEDHDRIVAELRAEVERLRDKLEVFRNREYGAENESELKTTIATQARVIEIATRTMATVLEIEHCGETSCPLPMRAMCSNESHKVLRSALREIAAIEKEGEK